MLGLSIWVPTRFGLPQRQEKFSIESLNEQGEEERPPSSALLRVTTIFEEVGVRADEDFAETGAAAVPADTGLWQ